MTVAGDSSSGRTTDSGSVSRGSNPLSPAIHIPPKGDSQALICVARSSSGLGHHPLKVETRVRVPYALPSRLKDGSHRLEKRVSVGPCPNQLHYA